MKAAKEWIVVTLGFMVLMTPVLCIWALWSECTYSSKIIFTWALIVLFLHFVGQGFDGAIEEENSEQSDDELPLT